MPWSRFFPHFRADGRRVPQAGRRRRQPSTVSLRLESLERRDVPAGTWTAFTNPAPQGIGTMMLLSDGSVLAQGAGVTNQWYKLTPGSNGGYATGTWSTLASMSLPRLYFGSNVLKDGQVFLVGGEYSGPSGTQNFTNTGEIYNPLTNSWSNITNFPQPSFGDDPTMLLDDGRVLCGYLSGPETYLYDPATDTWTQTGIKIRNNDRSDEETWLKLPDGSVLSYDIFNAVDHGQSTAQRYVPSTGQWVAAGTVPVTLSSSALGYELGGATILPDGRAWFVGCNGHTAFYTPSTNTWAAGPDLPGSQQQDDAPLCLMPNGHVLLAADGPGSTFAPPTHVYDYDPVANTFTQVDPPQNLSGVPAYTCRMLMLPDGRVAFEANGSSQLYVYTPDSGPNPTWAPAISNIVRNADGSFTLSGTQLNGISAGASYGDDAEMDSNYPIVEFLDNAGGFHYARTFSWSSTGVQTGSTPVTAQFTLPPGVTNGAYLVQVVTNGIPSAAVLEVVTDSGLNNVTLQIDPGNSGLYDVVDANTNTVVSQWAIGSFGAVVVSANGTAVTVNVKQSPLGVPVYINGRAHNTVNVDNAGSVQGIQGNLYIEDPAGVTTINVDDSADATARTVTVSTFTPAGDTPWGSVTGLAPAAINYEYADAEKVTIHTGTAAGNVVNVQATGPGGPTNVVSHATATVNVGNAGSVQAIQGRLNVENPAGTTTLTIDDSADATARTVALSNIGANPDDFQGNSDPWGQVSGLAPGTINYEYNDATSVTVKTGLGNDTVNVTATAGPSLTINTGGGNDTVNVGSATNTLDPIQSPFTVDGGTGSLDTLNLLDSGTAAGQSYTFNATSVQRVGTGAVTFAHLDKVVVTAGAFNDTFTALLPVPATAFTLNGGGGTNTLVGANTANTWTINGPDKGTLGAKVTFTSVQNLVGGSANDIFKFTGAGSLSGTINGGGGTANKLDYSSLALTVTVNLQTASAPLIDGGAPGGFSNIGAVTGSTASGNTLIGPNADTSWTVSSANGGKAGSVTFLKFQNLVGGSGVDVFKFSALGSLSGSLDGGAAPLHKGNWLDYSGLAAAVTVNLQTGAATGVAGGAAGTVANIQNVHGGNGGNTLTGSAQGNILIGGTGSDTITGGSGFSLLIGDKGSDTVTGNSSNDILTGDSTKYDTMSAANEAALMSILAEWQSADSYADRFGDINQGAAHASGSHLNGANLLKTGTGATVLDDSAAADTVTEAGPGTRQDWFFQYPGDSINNLPGEHLNNT
jgi:hypothetical protein